MALTNLLGNRTCIDENGNGIQYSREICERAIVFPDFLVNIIIGLDQGYQGACVHSIIIYEIYNIKSTQC